MSRYFAEISYLGKNYHGWQRQPNAITVQQTIEEAISTLLGRECAVIGCGRTDTGVHASQYYFHFDHDAQFEIEWLTYKLNRIVPDDIRVIRVFPVSDKAHARFDALNRGYQYFISFEKDPFRRETAYHFSFSHQCDWQLTQEAANLLLSYESFLPFCKSNSGVEHHLVNLEKSTWELNDETAVYTISGNRFLRGMVRLVVGACLNIGLGKITLDQLRDSMELQQMIPRSWSVPAHGLFLTEVNYPEDLIRSQPHQEKV